jgi:FkbM family methyltransferase
VWSSDLKFLNVIAAKILGTSNPPHQASGEALFYSLRKKLLHRRHRRTDHYSVFRWRDLNLLLDTKDFIARKILIDGGFEPDFLAAIEDRIARRKPAVFVDVGANFGLYGCIAASRGVPEIHSFEPNPRLAAFQRANFAMNGFSNIEIHECALADAAADDQDFLVSPRSNSGLSKLGNLTPDENWQHRKISLRRLDDVLSHTGGSAMLKVDVEGAERSFLAGAQRFLTNNRCDLFVEINEDFEETDALLTASGYARMKTFMDNNYWFANHRDSP